MDLEQARGLRDFILTYNKIVDHCFNMCVFSLTSRDVLRDEEECLDKCSQRILASFTRISRGFAETQVKKMDERVKANEELVNKETAAAAAAAAAAAGAASIATTSDVTAVPAAATIEPPSSSDVKAS